MANANFSVFRYQHVGIGNAKSSRWGSNPKPGPNASGFASQWNIGFRYGKGDGKVTFTRAFLMLDEVTFDKHVNALTL